MPKMPPRSVIYGVQPGRLGARSKRLVEKARAALSELSAIWGENYEPVSFDAERMLEQLDALPEVIDEGVSYLREPFGGADA